MIYFSAVPKDQKDPVFFAAPDCALAYRVNLAVRRRIGEHARLVFKEDSLLESRSQKVILLLSKTETC